MYKSRLHTWGLDKKKKEHEMLEIVRMGVQQNADKDRAFSIRGRSVTLGDALHYFNRKGIKDPTTLLDHAQTAAPDPHAELSSPEDADVKTPLSTTAELVESRSRGDSEYDFPGSPPRSIPKPPTTIPMYYKPTDFAEHRIIALQTALGVPELRPLPAFRTLSVESVVPATSGVPEEAWCVENVVAQLQQHYREIFARRGISVNSPWTTTSDDADADKFYISMYSGYSSLWNGQRAEADAQFRCAASLVPGLVKDKHVAFLITVLDLIIRYSDIGQEQPLLEILRLIAETAREFYGSNTDPTFLVNMYLLECTNTSRASVAEAAMRKLLDFFQDSIGYFHSETIAILQIFATALLNRKRYAEGSVRFQQLVDALETTEGKYTYDVCLALRHTSEVYFHMDRYVEALSALKMALERSEQLPKSLEREIYVRCLRALAEISRKLGRQAEAVETIRYAVDCTRKAFGADHNYTQRAEMHQKTIEKGESMEVSSIPPTVYRLGRGGAAAKHVWVTRSSPTRLEA